MNNKKPTSLIWKSTCSSANRLHNTYALIPPIPKRNSYVRTLNGKHCCLSHIGKIHEILKTATPKWTATNPGGDIIN